MKLKDKNVTIEDKLENLIHGHLSLEKESIKVHLDGWYLTNKGNLCKAICRYNNGGWKFLVQQEFGLIVYYCSNEALQFLEDEWVARPVPKSKGKELLIKAIYTHPDYNKRILWEYRLVGDENATWGRAYYVRTGVLCKPDSVLEGESDDR